LIIDKSEFYIKDSNFYNLGDVTQEGGAILPLDSYHIAIQNCLFEKNIGLNGGGIS